MTNNVSPAPIAHRPLILIACMLAMFMSAIEATIVATAMPTIIGDLGGFSLLGWVFAVYLLAQAITIPIYGRLADLYGRKRVFFFGATLFLLGSVLCGFAPDMYWLIGFRLLQGLGAGAIMPIASTIIGDIYSATERPKVMGYLSSVWGVSAIIGPLLGAFIVQHLPWALVFWVNLPIGLLAMLFLWRYLPAHQQLRRHALDLAGTAWLTLFVSALLLALLQMESLGWWVAPLLALAAAMLLAGLIGAATGALVAYVGAHPILVTLATMTTVNGIGIYLTRGAALSGMPEIVRFIGAERVLGVPVPLWIFLVVAALLALFLQKTRLGKCIYMSGSNINATHFSGVNTHRVLIAIYTLSSLLCVIAGLVMMARFNSARMGYGDSYLLLTVLAIILGGTDPFGGFGRVSGVVLALIVLQVIATGLNLMNVSPHFSLAMWGAVLIAVLALKFFRHRYQQRRAMRRSAAQARIAAGH
ncbi:MFS transporter [Serratia marcescens]|nr:MFS transporter [Serratia marcescens]RTF94857.1 MFS transporter [Serratia marcescens]